MADLTQEELDWLNSQMGSGGATVTDPSGATWRGLLSGQQGSGAEGDAGAQAISSWARDAVPGEKGNSSFYEQYSTAGKDLGAAQVDDPGFLQNWGPFMMAALPFALTMAPGIAAGLGGAAPGAGGVASADALTAGGSTFGLNAAEAAAGGGAAVGGGAGGFGTAAGTAAAGGAAGGAGAAGASVLGSPLARLAGGLGGLVAGGVGLSKAGSLADPSKTGQQTADPFGPERGKYAKMLSDLMADPAAVLPNTPGYKAGEQAVQRAGAAQGFTNSGNMAASLQKYGGDFFNNQVSQLSQLAGAQFSPAAAGQIQQQGQVNQTNMTGQAINSLTSGASSLFQLAGI